MPSLITHVHYLRSSVAIDVYLFVFSLHAIWGPHVHLFTYTHRSVDRLCKIVFFSSWDFVPLLNIHPKPIFLKILWRCFSLAIDSIPFLKQYQIFIIHSAVDGQFFATVNKVSLSIEFEIAISPLKSMGVWMPVAVDQAPCQSLSPQTRGRFHSASAVPMVDIGTANKHRLRTECSWTF